MVSREKDNRCGHHVTSIVLPCMSYFFTDGGKNIFQNHSHFFISLNIIHENGRENQYMINKSEIINFLFSDNFSSTH